MARIRSIHPGLFTDEAFMSASAHARLLMIGIWTEAWDDGVFEWKPLTLKVRLFPIDGVDVAALLNELEQLNFVRRFSARGREYGAIRNFKRYQKPKKPNGSGVLPSEFASYVAGSGDGADELGNGTETGSEPVPHGEEGKGREEESGEDGNRAGARPPPWPNDFEGQFSSAYPRAAGDPAKVRVELAAAQASGVDFVSLLGAVRSYAASTEAKFVCNPDKWVRERRWRNEPGFRADATRPASKVHVLRDSSQGLAWAEHELKGGRKVSWLGSTPGAYFDSEWPPEHPNASPRAA